MPEGVEVFRNYDVKRDPYYYFNDDPNAKPIPPSIQKKFNEFEWLRDKLKTELDCVSNQG